MKKKVNKIFFWLAISTILPFILGYASIQNKKVITWLAYWDIKNSLDTLESNFSDKIDEINLFFYAFDEEGNIINNLQDLEEYKKALKALSKINKKINVAVTNDIIYSKLDKRLKDPNILHKVLKDYNSRQKHIQQILKLAKEVNADGIDIDYENIDISDKDNFTKFIEELSLKTSEQNIKLIVTVQQKTEDHQRSGPGAVDWKVVSQHTDKIIIMCYNYSSKVTGPGPICPVFWLKDIIRFAKSQIPQEKICIALALHGYDWSKGSVNSLNFRKAAELIEKHSARLRWDRKSQTPYFRYSKGGISHQVWFEDQKSISRKIQIIKKYKINKIALWHLGILSPSLSEPLESF